MSQQLTDEELETYRAAVGRERVEIEVLDEVPARRFASALVGTAYDEPETVPLGRQWAYFLPQVTKATTGPDGHPRRGDFLPAVRLQRRMFATARMTLTEPLKLGKPAEKRSRIELVTRKGGARGDLVFVEVESRFLQGGAECVVERQTIVYLDARGPMPLPKNVPLAPMPSGTTAEIWTPDEVDLFRFSAVTFNGHRTHYDLDYTTNVEGYPALIVHGPLIASRLLDLAMRLHGRSATTFEFRAQAPCFVNQPIRSEAVVSGDAIDLTATRVDGQVSMTGRAGFGPVA